MTVDELKAAALRLAPQARADLARELLSSLDELSEAETELNNAADHYALQCPGLDQRFIAEIELALSQIVAFPAASSPGNAGPGARSYWATRTRSCTR